ncbi:MogA/MoaB family molybdenum cofactor biosynthesis protein [Ruania halotolerans]|uniref:MogA/MoaB family molybdenum cofactor biosynthesis protein n=1 Tax=Ruania halotolerans TaxID=2897773 RepID=UPI001E357370|nr:MogA/MoaB family molybdenum cofactor biosynthesis protein [Ruania halotolerans]UFU07226.1 MogA/MoaB family molybdenum cofactor biosynthesis protein [Ruania halotolerans]
MAAGIPAAVITVSDRCAAGERDDCSGRTAADLLADAGYVVAPVTVIPDGADAVERAIQAALEQGARLVLTTGGTGLSPRDRTPEGTARVLEYEVPGIAEQIRRSDAATVPTSILSRGLAGVVGAALVVNAPGSVSGVTTAVQVVLGVAAHVLDQLEGGDHP